MRVIKIKKTFFIIFSLIICIGFPASAFSINPEEQDDSITLKARINSYRKLMDKSAWHNAWLTIKGEPSPDTINLGMFSYHTMGIRDQLNESNKLIGIDYKGYSIGTYNNSYHTQTYYAGITRQIFEKELPWDSSVQLKYKVIALTGYRRYHPDLFGITPNIVPVLGFTVKDFGIDFLVSPGKTLTFATNFRINLPKFSH